MLPSHPVGHAYDSLQTPKDYINNLEQVIGRIPDHIKHDFVHNQSATFGDLTELLLQRASPAITMQVTGLLEKTYVSPYTSYLLPIRQLGPYESINVKWTEVSFNPGIAPQVETQGVGRYFSHNKTKRGARAVRRGAAVKIESGFFMTAEGRQAWVNQIEQLVTIIQNTNEYDVLLTLLQTPMRQERNAHQMNGPTNRAYGAVGDMSYEEQLILERDMFGLVNKVPDSRGFNSLVTNLRTVMSRNGTTADAMIVPPYLLGYYNTFNDDLWMHSGAGAASSQNRELAADIGGNSAFRSQSIQGLRVIDSHIYRSTPGSRSGVCDLLTAPFQIGEYYPLEIDTHFRDLKSFENYSGESRNVRIFNEDISRISTVHFSDALSATLRWDENGDVDSEDHNGITNDMFTNPQGKPCNLWEDVENKGLSSKHLERCIRSMYNNLFTKDKKQELEVALYNISMQKVMFEDGPLELNNDVSVVNSYLLDPYNDLRKDNQKSFDINDLLLIIKGDAVKYEELRQEGFKNKNSKHAELFRNKTYLERVLHAMFLTTPINIKTMIRMHEADIFVPVDIILARPSMTYNMSSVVIMKAGSDTGETIIGQQDFSMSSNTQDKTLEGFYTYYGKAIVKNSKNVIVAPRVFNQGYVRGNNNKFVTEDDGLKEIKEYSGLRESSESLIAMMVPCGGKIMDRSWIDYTGTNNNTDDTYHQSAEFYGKLFAVDSTELAIPGEDFVDYEDQSFQSNSICWLGHFETGKDFSFVNQNNGHLGPNTYDQVDHSRKEGIFAPIKHFTYNLKR